MNLVEEHLAQAGVLPLRPLEFVGHVGPVGCTVDLATAAGLAVERVAVLARVAQTNKIATRLVGKDHGPYTDMSDEAGIGRHDGARMSALALAGVRISG